MSFIAEIDGILTTATRTFFLILGLWGAFRAIRGQAVDGSYLGALAIGAILYAVGVALDLILFIGDIRPDRPSLHYLYAIFGALLIPFVYTSAVKGDDSNTAQWIWAFVTLFLWGLSVRILGL